MPAAIIFGKVNIRNTDGGRRNLGRRGDSEEYQKNYRLEESQNMLQSQYFEPRARQLVALA